MTDATQIPQGSLVTELRVPDANRDAIHDYLEQVCAAGIAKKGLKHENVGGIDLLCLNNELISEGLGLGIYKRLPADIQQHIDRLRNSQGEDKAVLVLRNLIVPSPEKERSGPKDDNHPNVMLLRAIGAMLGTDYGPQARQNGFYPMKFKWHPKAITYYHIDSVGRDDYKGPYRNPQGNLRADTEIRFSALLCSQAPGTFTAFVPLSEAARYSHQAEEYADNVGNKAALGAGDVMVWDNTRVLHAQLDNDPDGQQRKLLVGLAGGRDRSASPYPARYGDAKGRALVERFETILADKEKVARALSLSTGSGDRLSR